MFLEESSPETSGGNIFRGAKVDTIVMSVYNKALYIHRYLEALHFFLSFSLSFPAYQRAGASKAL